MIKNIQLIPPGGKYQEEFLSKIPIHHFIVIINYKNGWEAGKGFVTLKEALDYITEKINIELRKEEEGNAN